MTPARALLLAPTLALLASSTGAVADRPDLAAWRTVREVRLPAAPSTLADLALPPDVFGGSRFDLADLRLRDARGAEVPYALRVLRRERRIEPLDGRDYNRGLSAERAEVSLDLGDAPAEHNAVEVSTPGSNFRRRATLEGSADGRQWTSLAEKDLLRFASGGQTLDDRRIAYPPSRHRHLRLRVAKDPVADAEPLDPARLAARVLRQVEAPGETLTLPARLSPREPVRAESGPGSAWVLHLGADLVPCDSISVEVADPEFARDWLVEAGGAPGEGEPFRPVARGEWRRRAGEPARPLVARFEELVATRLRLVVTDHANPPLDLRSATFSAPVRQLVFARPEGGGTLRLYTGNPRAEPPHYDFARNLPARIEPPPPRATLGPAGPNPDHVPEPPPLAKRWPWLVHAVLGAAGLVLAVLIALASRAAIRRHDQAAGGE